MGQGPVLVKTYRALEAFKTLGIDLELMRGGYIAVHILHFYFQLNVFHLAGTAIVLHTQRTAERLTGHRHRLIDLKGHAGTNATTV